MSDVVAIQKEEGLGQNYHKEIQFYSEFGFTRIWPDKDMSEAEIMDAAVKHLNQCNLIASIYFAVNGAKALRYYDGGDLILIFCYHPDSKTGFWFTVKKDKGDYAIQAMTKNMPDVDIRVNVLHGRSMENLMLNHNLNASFRFFFFVS
jgi:hypothetical protein